MGFSIQDILCFYQPSNVKVPWFSMQFIIYMKLICMLIRYIYFDRVNASYYLGQCGQIIDNFILSLRDIF